MRKFITGSILIICLFAACVKKVDPVDSSNATVTLSDAGKNSVTTDVVVNPKDSLVFSFTIASARNMKYVSIQKNPVNQTAFLVRDTLTDANMHSYTTVKKLMADSINGDYLYRIVAHDATGTYIGHKDIRVTVKADINYYTYRFLQAPDTTDKVNTAFMSATTGNVYSYSNGAANSALIDFGFYYDTTTANKFSIYALNSPQPQLPFYDISSWTKNATILKKFGTTIGSTPNQYTFTLLNSAAALRSAANLNLSSGTSSKVTALAAANLVLFKTASGKVGCIQINYINGSSAAKDTYINVDVKIEK